MTLLLLACLIPPASLHAAEAAGPARRLYWFIPDGMRAEERLLKVFEWARKGELPNIRRMMENGSYGYSTPDFPSHTPTNFASLLTGAHPSVHGVADGPMHLEGFPLERPSIAGFSSTAKKVPPVWTLLEAAGMKTVLLSVPGSTPPELRRGVTFRGRWGGWGADTPALVVEPAERRAERRVGRGLRLFYLGAPLTRFVERRPASGWSGVPKSFSPAWEAELEAYDRRFLLYVYDSADDGKTAYDRLVVALAKDRPLEDLRAGQRGRWHEVELGWKGAPLPSRVQFKLIQLQGDGIFRLRAFFDNMNRLSAEPPEAAERLSRAAGPMVDFPDNWPAQLVFEPEDREAFLEEARASLEWHRKAAGAVFDLFEPDAFIQDIYTPNQMLESRWWLGRAERPDRDPEAAAEAVADLLAMYRGVDAILGAALAKAGPETVVVLSSDHGIAALRRQVKLNNLFARKGWLKFETDPSTGEPAVDWARTKVAFLKMAHVYVGPEGLGGPWRRASGPAYEALRAEVAAELAALEDEDGTRPLVRAVPHERAEKELGLPPERVGDLVLQVLKGYQWLEEPDASLELFVDPLGSGYKQANDPEDPDMGTPFVVMGPGVRKGFRLERPIRHVDQLPTILTLLGIPVPAHVQGRTLEEVLER